MSRYVVRLRSRPRGAAVVASDGAPPERPRRRHGPHHDAEDHIYSQAVGAPASASSACAGLALAGRRHRPRRADSDEGTREEIHDAGRQGSGSSSVAPCPVARSRHVCEVAARSIYDRVSRAWAWAVADAEHPEATLSFFQELLTEDPSDPVRRFELAGAYDWGDGKPTPSSTMSWRSRPGCPATGIAWRASSWAAFFATWGDPRTPSQSLSASCRTTRRARQRSASSLSPSPMQSAHGTRSPDLACVCAGCAADGCAESRGGISTGDQGRGAGEVGQITSSLMPGVPKDANGAVEGCTGILCVRVQF